MTDVVRAIYVVLLIFAGVFIALSIWNHWWDALIAALIGAFVIAFLYATEPDTRGVE